MPIKWLAMVFIVAVGLSPCAGAMTSAADVEQLRLRAADWEKPAIKALQQHAQRGNPDAQRALASLYASGEGIFQDYPKALHWYTKAANQGLAQAQYELGMLLSDEFLEEEIENLPLAVQWLRKAAQQNHPLAQSRLGRMYYYGQGVNQDLGLAKLWHTKAAEQGNVQSQLELAQLLDRRHQGFDRDIEQAIHWYQAAAKQASSEAQRRLGEIYEKGDGVTADANQAFSWYQLAANNGQPQGQFHMGYCFHQGVGVSVDYEQAFVWYNKAVEQNNEAAQFQLGEMYWQGQGRPKDADQALQWYLKAADQNYIPAFIALAKVLLEQPGAENKQKAYQWLLLAQRALNPKATLYATVTAQLQTLAALLDPLQIQQAEQEAQKLGAH